MPAIIDKIADALHLHKHKHEATPAAPAATEDSAGPSSAAESSIVPEKLAVVDTVAAPAATPKVPVFDNEKVTVLFVLGGPGAGRLFFRRANESHDPLLGNP